MTNTPSNQPADRDALREAFLEGERRDDALLLGALAFWNAVAVLGWLLAHAGVLSLL